MKAAQIVGVIVAGAMSTGMLFAESHGGKMEKGWDKRHAQRAEFREKIAEELKKQDEDLLKVQENLKSAPSDKKIDALSAAVNTLIDQRLKLHKKMEEFGKRFEGEHMPPATEKKTLPVETP